MSFLFLPKLKKDTYDEGSDVRPGVPGKWEVRPPRTFLTIAKSLDTGEDGQKLRTVTSIPSIWARALLTETALHNQNYPMRDLIIEQWQGMLAAIALADARQFDIKVQFIKLKEYINQDENGSIDPFARALYELRPQPTYALYQLDDESHTQDNNPWQELYTFLWNPPQSESSEKKDTGYRVVGISSPSTLVCPAEGGKWTGLDWYDKKGRLSSPIEYLNSKEKIWLSLWLGEIIKELPKYSSPESGGDNFKNARANILQILEQFQDNLKINSSGHKLERIEKLEYFGTQIKRGALELLKFPIKALPQPSNVKVISSNQKKETAPYLLLIDPQIHKQWDKKKQDIWIYDNKTLATINLLRDLKRDKFAWKGRENKKLDWIYKEDLLLTEFYFIKKKNALLNNFTPKGGENLSYEGNPITPLIPLNSKLLDCFTAKDLSEMLVLEMKGDKFVKVSLSLPLSGFEDDSPDKDSPKNYQYSHTYLLQEDNVLKDAPVLELWPNFQASDWHEYYLFYYDQGLGQNTFSLDLQDKAQSKNIKDGQNNYQIHQLEQCPEVITCYRETEQIKQEVGVIFLKPPENLNPSEDLEDENHGEKWKVGVDFGTSFTNVYFNADDTPKPLNLEPRLIQLTDIVAHIRDGVLIEFFISDNPTLLRLPLPSVLTIRPLSQLRNLDNGGLTKPFLDGRIYITENSIKLKPQQTYIKTGLKWSKEPNHQNNTKLFLNHLVLEITALAKEKKVSSIEWFVSYPSAFSHIDKVTYSQIWEDITKNLQQTTGIEHIPPSPKDSVHWRSESIAMAQYFVDRKDKQLVYASCVDIGGGTSDISIIESNRLLYQCSIQLAGYDLLTQFMEANPAFLVKHFGVDKKEWADIKTDKFASKFDVLLRQDSEVLLKKNPQTIASKDREFQELLQLIALGSSGLYYYIGILLRVLHTERKYRKGEITPVYLGGNGSKIFHWLAAGGRYRENSLINQLFRQMLLLGSGWEMPEGDVTIYLSEDPKAEVSCGLVLSGKTDKTLLKGWDDKKLIEDTLIAGEFCQVNGQEVTPYERMPLISDQMTIENFFQVNDSFKKLKEFVTGFNEFVEQSKTMKELGIKPIIVDNKDYKDVSTEVERHILNFKDKKGADLRPEPAFTLALKKLLKVLGKRWVKSHSKVK